MVNISDHQLTEAQHNVLEKGLGFVPTNRIDTFRIHVEMQEFILKLKLKAFFKDKVSTSEPATDTGLRLKSTFTHPMPHCQ